MSLKVIGAGLGRTGTNSLKIALEILGFARCHHMIEVMANPHQAAGFLAAARGEAVDWDKLFAGYQASCDWPSCYFWRELSTCYPDAKVILTLRSGDSWYRSMSETLLPFIRKAVAGPPGPARDIGGEIVLQRTFSGNIDEKDHVIGVFERHNQAVRDAIAPERLLEFEAVDGWDPLCAFLELPVPDEPYPNANTMDAFKQRTSAVESTAD